MTTVDYSVDPLRVAVVEALRAVGAEPGLVDVMVYASSALPLPDVANALLTELEERGLRLDHPPQVLAHQVRVTVLDLIDRQCTVIVNSASTL